MDLAERDLKIIQETLQEAYELILTCPATSNHTLGLIFKVDPKKVLEKVNHKHVKTTSEL